MTEKRAFSKKRQCFIPGRVVEHVVAQRIIGRHPTSSTLWIAKGEPILQDIKESWLEWNADATAPNLDVEALYKSLEDEGSIFISSYTRSVPAAPARSSLLKCSAVIVPNGDVEVVEVAQFDPRTRVTQVDFMRDPDYWLDRVSNGAEIVLVRGDGEKISLRKNP